MLATEVGTLGDPGLVVHAMETVPVPMGILVLSGQMTVVLTYMAVTVLDLAVADGMTTALLLGTMTTVEVEVLVEAEAGATTEDVVEVEEAEEETTGLGLARTPN